MHPSTNDRSGCRFERLMSSLNPPARLPSDAWLRFLSGPLSCDDWALVGRVENDELSVDQALTRLNSNKAA